MTRRLLAVLTLLPLVLAVSSIAQTKLTEHPVDLTSTDGTNLKATFFPAAKSGPGVLLLHQCNKNRKIWDGLARQLANSGINVVTLDLRNFGESAGKPADQLTPQEAQAAAAKWPDDIDAAYKYLVSQPGVKRNEVGVGGASCGVNNSVQTAMRHPEVKSLVLLAGSTDLNGRKFLRETKVPILFGYADDDEFPASIKTIQWLYSLDPSPAKKMVRYANGGHGAEIFAAHPEFEGVIKDWFVTTLIKMPGRAPAEKEAAAIPKNLQVLDVIDSPGGPAKVSQMLAEARKSDPKATLFPEDLVNVVGYEHLQSGDTKGAVEILKLNAEAYPNSTNVYDSLSDAYLADGQKELALVNVKKAMEMLKTDSTTPQQMRDAIRASCEQKLKQLEQN